MFVRSEVYMTEIIKVSREEIIEFGASAVGLLKVFAVIKRVKKI